MKNLITFGIAVLVLIVGCKPPQGTTAANMVPERELSAFIEQAKTGDFHGLARTGNALLKTGLLIPDHKTKLKDFPSGISEEGQVRYELMSFRGDSSAGGILLFLKVDTGEIIAFRPMEATF